MKAGIFGGLETTLSADISKQMSTGYVTSATFKVPANDTVYCDRGIVNERVSMLRTRKWNGGGDRKVYTAKAPSRARWWIFS